jgi:competence protein ComEC
MTIGLCPLLLALFQQVSLASPIANALAIPLVSLIVVPLTLLSAFTPFEWPHFVMSLTMQFLEWLNQLPQVVWIQHAPPAWAILSGILGTLLILAPRGFPARWLGIVFLLPLFFNKPDVPAENTLRMIVFDVGQGLSVLVQTHQHTLLYDSGQNFSGKADSGNRILLPTLRALGIGKLDGLILSHDDSDHTGGAASIMQVMPIGWLSSSLDIDHPLTLKINSSRHCINGNSWEWDGVYFEMLHPGYHEYKQANKKDNDMSCVLRISIADKHILLTADITRHSEQRLLEAHPDKLAADILIVPHHGSKTSSISEFIAAVQPKYAIFTVGYRSRYGHPKEQVVERYRNIGAELFRSDQDRAILIEMNANEINLERFRKTNRRYWTD